MTLTLTSADVARLEAAMHAMLSLLDHGSSTEWHHSLCDALRDLVAADHASLFESGDAPLIHVSTHGETAMREYLDHHVHRDPVTSQLAARAIECGCSWDVIAPREFRRTEFYADYVRRHGLYDGLGYRVRSGPASHTWLTFHYDSEQGEDEIRRRARLLGLLLPAFRAGVRLDRRMGDWRQSAVRAVDDQPDGVLLCTASGRVLHANPALRRIVDADPEGSVIWGSVTAMARQLAASASGDPILTTTRQVRTALGTYVVTAVLSGQQLAPAHITAVVHVVTASDDELHRRYGLTAREVQVARLLAAGHRNADVAAALGISQFTARRHTERVLQKLGVASRAQVASRLGV